MMAIDKRHHFTKGSPSVNPIHVDTPWMPIVNLTDMSLTSIWE
jgi:hypothetical protein